MDAKAETLLSTMSAIADSSVYPIALVDSISVGAYGGNVIVFIFRLLRPPYLMTLGVIPNTDELVCVSLHMQALVVYDPF
jgi:hypothetical protein